MDILQDENKMLKNQISELEAEMENFENLKADIETLTSKASIGQKTKLYSDLQVAETLKNKIISLRQHGKNLKLKIEDLEEEIIEHKDTIKKQQFEIDQQSGN